MNQYGNQNQQQNNPYNPVNQYGNQNQQQNNPYNPVNQYGNQNQQQNNQNNQNNNYYSNPANNYAEINAPLNEPAEIKPLYDPVEMAEFFSYGMGASFKANENEIKITRFLNGGTFVWWPRFFSFVLVIASIVGGIYLFPKLPNSEFSCFGVIAVIVIAIIITELVKFGTIIVNEKGITAKTVIGKYFIPKEKIDFCNYESVQRINIKGSSRYGHRRHRNHYGYGNRGGMEIEQILYLCLIVHLKDKNTIDTGLCYGLGGDEALDYLKGECNRILGVKEREIY